MFLRMSDCEDLGLRVFFAPMLNDDKERHPVVGAGLLAPVKSKGSGCA